MVGDGGCCGWDNAGDDQTRVAMNGRDIRIFDEQQSYGNPDYDVSFYTANAGLSPGMPAAALTIVSSAKTGDEIRSSDSGKENPGELARIRESLQQLPMTEVISLSNPARPLHLLHHASFAGWLNDREILIVENGLLTAFDTAAKTRRVSRITVPDIFLLKNLMARFSIYSGFFCYSVSREFSVILNISERRLHS